MTELICEWGQPADIATALRQVEATVEIGAAYAKWQVFEPERLASLDAERYWDKSLGGSESQLETFADRALSEADWWLVAKACRTRGVEFLATPFDLEAVDLLESLDVVAYKIASGDITYRPLLERIRETGKRVYLSTGASTDRELARAVRWLKGCEVIPFACDLAYPCQAEDANPSRIRQLREKYVTVGFSDHTREVITGAVAVSLGATVLEKHVTLNPDGGSPDDRMALTVEQAREYREYAEGASTLMAEVKGDPQAQARIGARRSAYAARPLSAGHVLGNGDVAWLRPAPVGSLSPTKPLDGRTLVGAIGVGERIERGNLI